MFIVTFNLSTGNAFNLDEVEIVLSGKGLSYEIQVWQKHCCVFQVPDGAYMGLVPKQTPSIYDLSITSDKSFGSKGYEYRRLGAKDECKKNEKLPIWSISSLWYVDFTNNHFCLHL